MVFIFNLIFLMIILGYFAEYFQFLFSFYEYTYCIDGFLALADLQDRLGAAVGGVCISTRPGC